MSDLTNQNLSLIESLTLHDMTLEEMIAADSEVESKFHWSDGVCWREVKPFFYQPANFLSAVTPGECRPSRIRALGGYYHRVPEGASSNGAIVVNEITDPAGWDLDSVRKTKRQLIRKGLAALRIARITDPGVLLDQGYDVYLSWEARTRDVRVKRTSRLAFREWMSRNQRHPHNLILGAFAGDRLAAYIIARGVQGTADVAKAFSHSEFHQYEPTTTLLYAYLRICGHSPGIKRACDGLRSLKTSLEQYKAGLGFRHVSYPAYVYVPALLRPILKRSMPKEYRRLMGDYGDTRTPEVTAAA